MAKLQRIDWQPGHRIDWTGSEGPVIRDVNGKVVATDLMITEADAARLKERFIQHLKDKLRPH